MSVREEALLKELPTQILLYRLLSFVVINFKSWLPGIYVTIKKTVDIPKGPTPAKEEDFSRMRKMEKDKERKREGEKGLRELEGVNPFTTAVIIVNNKQSQNSVAYNHKHGFITVVGQFCWSLLGLLKHVQTVGEVSCPLMAGITWASLFKMQPEGSPPHLPWISWLAEPCFLMAQAEAQERGSFTAPTYCKPKCPWHM